MIEYDWKDADCMNGATMITVITMYRGHDAEMFVQVVDGVLTEAEKEKWRSSHYCDDYHEHTPSHEDCDECNNMFFRTLDPQQCKKPSDLMNVDEGEK